MNKNLEEFMKKRISAVLASMMLMAALAACTPAASTTTAGGTATGTTSAAVEMKKMSVDDAAAKVGQAGYTFIDLRKAADVAKSTVKTAIATDISAAIDAKNYVNAIEPLKAVVKDKTDTLVLVCYTGNSYAQAASNALKDIGYDMSKVYTLDGGFKAFSAAKADLLVTPSAPVAMQKMSVDDAAAKIDQPGFLFIDLRKTADVAKSTMKSAIAADISAAVEAKNSSLAVEPLKALVKDKTDTVVLVCYTGNSYAQAASNALQEIGYDMSKVYTLDGGFKAFSAAKADLVITK